MSTAHTHTSSTDSTGLLFHRVTMDGEDGTQ
jgi:hypothetical protein